MTHPAALQFTAPIQNGWIPGHMDKLLRGAVAKAEGKKVTITVKPYRKSRSNPQNAFYWGVVVPLIRRMFEDAGNTMNDEDVHCFLRAHVGGLTNIVHTPDGLARNVLKSSTALTTIEWEMWMEKIRAWAAPFDVVIPLPNEAGYE